MSTGAAIDERLHTIMHPSTFMNTNMYWLLIFQFTFFMLRVSKVSKKQFSRILKTIVYWKKKSRTIWSKRQQASQHVCKTGETHESSPSPCEHTSIWSSCVCIESNVQSLRLKLEKIVSFTPIPQSQKQNFIFERMQVGWLLVLFTTWGLCSWQLLKSPSLVLIWLVKTPCFKKYIPIVGFVFFLQREHKAGP